MRGETWSHALGEDFSKEDAEENVFILEEGRDRRMRSFITFIIRNNH
jgi:hypothetical protein